MRPVRIAKPFWQQMERIEAHCRRAEVPWVYARLLDGIQYTVIPNLAQSPAFGRRYEHAPSDAALLADVLHELPPATQAREYIHGDYLIVYTTHSTETTLMAIRHHREGGYHRPHPAEGPAAESTEQ